MIEGVSIFYSIQNNETRHNLTCMLTRRHEALDTRVTVIYTLDMTRVGWVGLGCFEISNCLGYIGF